MTSKNARENKRLIMERLRKGLSLGGKKGEREASKAFDELEDIAKLNAYLEVFEAIDKKLRKMNRLVTREFVTELFYDVRIDFEV